jgi:hypothetical protein
MNPFVTVNVVKTIRAKKQTIRTVATPGFMGGSALLISLFGKAIEPPSRQRIINTGIMGNRV